MTGIAPAVVPTASFIEYAGRELFCLDYAPPSGAARAHVALLPPIAEELNKCRRLLSLSATALAQAGFSCRLGDLSGTGDSSGEFADASWSAWCDDACAIHRVDEPTTVIVLALRGGSLFVDPVVAALDRPVAGLLTVQPVLKGQGLLQQLMRVRLMADKLAGGNESAGDLRKQWDSGSAVELSGYRFSAQLADGLAAASLSTNAGDRGSTMMLLECNSGARDALSTQYRRFLDAASAAGIAATGQLLSAEAFWASQEVSAPDSVVAAIVAACVALCPDE